MKKATFIFLFTLLMSQIIAQCYVSSIGEVDDIPKEFQSYDMYKNNGLDVRVTVWILTDDNGNGGVDQSALESVLDEVEDNFTILNPHFCIKYLRDSHRLNVATGTDRFLKMDVSLFI